jgi:hypothetical protein
MEEREEKVSPLRLEIWFDSLFLFFFSGWSTKHEKEKEKVGYDE